MDYEWEVEGRALCVRVCVTVHLCKRGVNGEGNSFLVAFTVLYSWGRAWRNKGSTGKIFGFAEEILLSALREWYKRIDSNSQENIPFASFSPFTLKTSAFRRQRRRLVSTAASWGFQQEPEGWSLHLYAESGLALAAAWLLVAKSQLRGLCLAPVSSAS